jgi:hypothetical protein
MNKTIVAVCFEDRNTPGNYGGKRYNYYTEIALNPGDIVLVPFGNKTISPLGSNESKALVVEIDVPESRVDERVMPLLKTISKLYVPPQESADNPKED